MSNDMGDHYERPNRPFPMSSVQDVKSEGPGILRSWGLQESWNYGALGPRNPEALGSRDAEILGTWGPGIMGCWDPEIAGRWGPGILGFWDAGILGSWGAGALGFWEHGVKGPKDLGILGPWDHREALFPSAWCWRYLDTSGVPEAIMRGRIGHFQALGAGAI